MRVITPPLMWNCQVNLFGGGKEIIYYKFVCHPPQPRYMLDDVNRGFSISLIRREVSCVFRRKDLPLNGNAVNLASLRKISTRPISKFYAECELMNKIL